MGNNFILVNESTRPRKQLINVDHIVKVENYNERATFLVTGGGGAEVIMTDMPWSEAFNILVVNHGRMSY